MTSKPGLAESVKYWKVSQLFNVELLCATYTTQNFSRHIHEGYALGVIEQGALAFSYRGERVIAPAGSVNLVIPGEAHDGYAAMPAGWTYRMFYIAPEVLKQVTYNLFGQERSPYFSAGVIQDRNLANQISTLHRLLEEQSSPKLEQESLFIAMLTSFVARHSDRRTDLRYLGKEDHAVKLVKDYIEDHYSENISLQDLSTTCHLSTFHLIRVFKNTIGVPPHIYLKQVRIRRAKEFLAKGLLPVFVAQEMGFVDQSHFSKQFKQITGVTPSQYSNFIQEQFRSNDVI